MSTVRDRAFFAGAPSSVARLLIGATVVVDGVIEAEITEVEAYGGSEDPASHAARGPTPRSAIMFGPPGVLYVYRSYGIHHCANIVTCADGVPGAVLVRAAAVVRGLAEVRRRRPSTLCDDRLLSGPGNLCRGLGLTLADNGLDITAADSRVALVPATGEEPVSVGPRVGISRAIDVPHRVWRTDDPSVSGRKAGQARSLTLPTDAGEALSSQRARSSPAG
jgi:DNA-3-methyladenine glycosylase